MKLFIPNFPYLTISHSINFSLVRPANTEKGWKYDVAQSNAPHFYKVDEAIKLLDETGIKKRYRELRRSGENTHGKGGGIGLYEIAKLVKDIEFNFMKIDESTYSYEFIAQIVSTRKEKLL